MLRIVLTFGLLAGALLSAMMLAMVPFQDRIGFDSGMVIGYTTMVMASLFIYFGVRAYRDQLGGRPLTFRRAFLVGLSIVAVSTACYVATWEVIYYGLAPDYGEKYAAHVIEQERRSGASEAEIAEKAAEIQRFAELYRNPLVNIAFTLLEPLPVGLLANLISSLALRTRRPRIATTAIPGSAA